MPIQAAHDYNARDVRAQSITNRHSTGILLAQGVLAAITLGTAAPLAVRALA
jgi:hypothetical protein